MMFSFRRALLCFCLGAIAAASGAKEENNVVTTTDWPPACCFDIGGRPSCMDVPCDLPHPPPACCNGCKCADHTVCGRKSKFDGSPGGDWVCNNTDLLKGSQAPQTTAVAVAEVVSARSVSNGIMVFRISVGAGCDKSSAGRDVAAACKALGGTYGYPFGPSSDFCGCTIPKTPVCEKVAMQEACEDIGGLCEQDKFCHLKGGMAPVQERLVTYAPTLREGNMAGTCGKESSMAYSAEEACKNLGGVFQVLGPKSMGMGMGGCSCDSPNGDLHYAPEDCAYIGGVASEEDSNLCVPLGSLPLPQSPVLLGLDNSKSGKEEVYTVIHV